MKIDAKPMKSKEKDTRIKREVSLGEGDKLKVMLVDDNAEDRILMEEILSTKGYDVTTYSVPGKAFEAYNKNFFPLVILDWNIEKISGVELCKKIRKIPQSEKSVILMISGRNKENDLLKAFESGIDDYLFKPINRTAINLRLVLAERLINIRRERDGLEKAYIEEEDKYRKIFESIQDVYFRTDLKGKILEISPSIKRYSGYRRHELLGKNVSEFYYALEDRNLLLKTLKGKKEVLDFEIRMKHKNKNTIYASVNAHLLEDPEYRVIGIEGFLRDITERKNAELEIKENKLKMERLSSELEYRVKELSCLHNISESIENIKSKDDLFVEITNLIASGMRYPDKVMARIIVDEREYSAFDKIEFGFNIISSDIGVFRQIRGVLEVGYTDDSAISDGEVNLFHNIAKRLGIVVERDELMLNEKSAALGKLAAGMAHEINNPASAIRSDINTLQLYAEKLPESNIKEKMLNIIFRDAQAISRVTDIVSAVKSVHRPNEWHSVNIHDEIELQLTLLNKEYRDRIEIIKEFRTLPDVVVHGSDVGQVILNLLSNAIDAIEDEGEIIIATNDDDKFISVEIKDNGSGIPEDILSQINQPFFTTKDVGKGTGLGLYASQLIAEKHGGDLFVSENAVGRGAAFTL